ncbi:5-methyltetrahydropteroyltriglutamate--homocysteine S-methyltransferase [Alkalihalobacillus pseudalcaliphilus]|uniref:5-methyltetrahydropteroyltriglutamate-- homocysteine S-methyltransferase n=1 Tax=Alkalihalobacillus pseudalcaliphilus TaxID=79884 RepID=UPI00064DFA8F|nr:5-methyltetrahydropteroyltriglutamate--homocysteine S-methyltransferase [Alkalihalobacillus pseudalcaliphilus]KMK74711.1 5-methyltetrahydropteroyltriglutamate--homocysteine methyltransferase [Alkalihalobacillus pseudalcaliphilus]
MGDIRTSNLGYPRIGEKREWKKALEAFWSKKIDEPQLLANLKEQRLIGLKKQKEAGIDYIPVGDFTFYDHVLDHAVMFGLIPKRFQESYQNHTLTGYFDIARGNDAAPASEMTKWFNTNYHYIVPEWEGQTPKLQYNKPLEAYQEAQNELGITGKPVLIGPFTFLKLSKGYEQTDFSKHLESLLPLYVEVLQQLEQAGCEWVQIDEPSLVTSISEQEIDLVSSTYHYLNERTSINVMVQTYFDAVSHYEKVIQLPVAGIGLDFVHGKDENLSSLQKHGFPSNKVLGAGIIDGRNIWRANLSVVESSFSEILSVSPTANIWLQPSSSLLHVPVTKKAEHNLDELVQIALAFADEKLQELVNLRDFFTGNETIKSSQQAENDQISTIIQNSTWRKQDEQVTHTYYQERQTAFSVRQQLQAKKFQLPPLPTTTIGSFPQTKEVRRNRNLWRKGELTNEAYETFVNEQIEKWVHIQEDLGIDVLVHGEFERNDMVEYFGEKLAGFVFTKGGWVQSYGSRCVKPPVIFGDVKFVGEMTVKETKYAQSLTAKPVKGMLTGPVTILNWSFVRDDIPRKDVALQIAEALIHEVQALEAAGIEMIQVDEPAIREGLPLKEKDWDTYLNWAVEAFRISTAQVKETTQIHTHMCYSDFRTIINSISALDADVISIETSRSAGDIISTFETKAYDKGIGLGVYDIHSPRVPSVEEMEKVINRALEVLPKELFWVNPDCGLKTRGEEETVAALKHMVQAAEHARETIGSSQKV